jgi:MSHA biogenesis protein MshE
VRQKVKIGDFLVEQGAISEDQLGVATAEQKKRKWKLGRTLVELGFLTEERFLSFVARYLEIPFVDLRRHPFEAETIRRLPETHARRFRALVLDDSTDQFLVGMADPMDIFSADEIARALKHPIRRAVVRESDLLRVLDLAYRRTEEITKLAGELRAELSESGPPTFSDLVDEDEASSAPVVKLLASLFEDAVRMNASDIHVEPGGSVLRLRQRVDGILHEQVMKEARIAPALVQRIKLMAAIDISEKRIPQDGRFHIKIQGHDIDVRVSTMPIQHGESVVMRLLDQSAGILDLDQLGMTAEMLRRVRSLLRSPHGMILVTGPTGSGKTTTLYAALSELNRVECKIITVEEPVEYRIPRINQVQVNPKIDLTFARVLRSALRQDPDIVMVGEIRDHETAQIGLRAALTGHLVLSTLHTNDAISAAIRLIDVGAEGYLVASSLRAVIAQRLVRRICEGCIVPHAPVREERQALAALVGPSLSDMQLKRGTGCSHCNDTGYRGRIGIYELLELDAAMVEALRRSDSASYARAAHNQRGFRPRTRAGLDYAQQGVTTLQEVLRVAGDVDQGDWEAESPKAPAGGSDA